MNKIVIDNDQIILNSSDEKIKLSLSDKLDIFDVIKVRLEILESTNIEIIYKKNITIKLDWVITLNENLECQINEKNETKELKNRYQYELKKNSRLEIHKFYVSGKVKELDVIHLNGENADISYYLNTLAISEQKYDMYVYHTYPNTNSNICHKGVTLKEGTISFNVTGFVYKGIKNCNLNQYNRIINLNNLKSVINPILLIDEQDVVANHSAYIGTLDEDALFYLKSRGICEKEAEHLLVKGFLLEEKNEEYEKLIDCYWR